MKLPMLDRTFVRAGGAADGEVFYGCARSVCPACGALVDAARVIRGGRVYLRKHCPEHGASEALVSGDDRWFLGSLAVVKPGSVPLRRSTGAVRGCPRDCGLCPGHEQHTCLPIIEVTNHCDLDCPICIVRNRHNWVITREEFAGIVDGLVASEGTIDAVSLSGGEPTLHPHLLDLVDIARRPGIARVSLSTNGRRLADDFDLCRELARRGVYVALQYDAPGNAAHAALRGPGDHAAIKERALANIERAGLRATLVATVARGVNDGRVGDCIRLLLEKDFVLSLLFQPAAYAGSGAAFSPHDPLDVVTIPDVVRAAEEQTAGVLRRSDFLPMPCSHPSCFALTYLLKTSDGWVPFPRFLDLGRWVDVLCNRATLEPGEELEEAMRGAIDELWSSAGQIPDSGRILAALKTAVRLLYPPDRATAVEERIRTGEGLVKTIFVHAFMDEHTFDVERVRKCCTHYALPDGRLMPGCAYNVFHRRRAGG